MAKVELQEVHKGESATLYTFKFDGEEISEFEKFVTKLKDNSSYDSHLQMILTIVAKIASQGAFERNFRYEGNFGDGIGALPTYPNKLRLYCLRISDQILVLGNGGVKKTQKLQDDEELNGYVIALKVFKRLLEEAVQEGKIQIEEKEITNLDEGPIFLGKDE